MPLIVLISIAIAITMPANLLHANVREELGAFFSGANGQKKGIEFFSENETGGESGINFKLKPDILNSGSGQLWGRVFSKEEFLKSSEMTKIYAIDQLNSHELQEDDYETFIATKQAYLIKDTTIHHFKRGFDLYKDPAFAKAANSDQTLIFPSEASTDYDWLVHFQLQIPWAVRPLVYSILTIRNVYAEVRHVKWYPETDLTDEIQALISSFDPDMGLAAMIAITTSNKTYLPDEKDPKKLGKSPHNYYRGSVSYTAYYPVNQDQDLAVITYQFVKIALYLPSMLRNKGEYFYRKGTESSVSGIRNYFWDNSEH